MREHFQSLINLDVTAILDALFAKNAITLTQKNDIDEIPSRPKKMNHLLSKIILPNLSAGVIDSFKIFLEVMEESEDTTIQIVGSRLGI